MKLETAVVYAKLFCVFAGTSLLTLQTGLGQWSNAETNPTPIQWVMILGGSLGTGLTATGAFLSNAFGIYLNGGSGGQNPPSGSYVFMTPNNPLTIPKRYDTLGTE
jgi:hypothetical protein